MEHLYSLPYPPSVYEEYVGGLALDVRYKGHINFCWLCNFMSEKDMEKYAQQNADNMGKEVILVIHENGKKKIFKPKGEK